MRDFIFLESRAQNSIRMTPSSANKIQDSRPQILQVLYSAWGERENDVECNSGRIQGDK